MKAALFQYNPVWEDKQKNKNKIKSMLKKVDDSFDLIVFPELSLTGFTMKTGQFKESFEDETIVFFKELSVQYQSHIFAGFIENGDGKNYNTLFHIDKTSNLLTSYRKIHPFSYSSEEKYYGSGDTAIITQIDDWDIGLSVCYDLRFPELYRYYGKEKVDLIINIANWPVQRAGHWVHLLRSRAIENQCYIIGVNRIGQDKANKYCGASAAFAPLGENIVIMEDKEKVEIIELDKNIISNVRSKYPFLNDIRLI